MYCIKYRVDNQEGIWIDPNIRGNREPLTYTLKAHADKECDILATQYHSEGFIFWVELYQEQVETI